MNRRTAVLAGAVVLGAVLLALAGTGQDAPCRDCNILMISVDPLPAAHVGAHGYHRNTTPTIDRLADRSYVFNRTFTASGHTLPALYSTFTSTYVSRHGVTPLSPEPASRLTMLAEVLDEAGYRTVSYNGGSNIGAEYGFDRGFDVFRSLAVNRTEIASGRFKEDLPFLLRETDEQPYFLFYQTFYPHDPYFTTEPYRSMFAPYNASRYDRSRDLWLRVSEERLSEGDVYNTFRPLYFGAARNDSRARAHLVARYDGAVRRVDTFLDRMLTALRDADRLDDTIIVVTSQHGEQFFQHGGRGHDTSLYNEVVHVPLIVHMPGQESRTTVDRFTSLIDLAPTLIDLVGADAAARRTGFTAGRAGESLRPLMEGRSVERRFVLAEGNGEYAFIDVPSSIKYYAAEDGDLFFDLSTDMAEQQPLEPSNRTMRIAARAERIRASLGRANVTGDPWPYFAD